MILIMLFFPAFLFSQQEHVSDVYHVGDIIKSIMKNPDIVYPPAFFLHSLLEESKKNWKTVRNKINSQKYFKEDFRKKLHDVDAYISFYTSKIGTQNNIHSILHDMLILDEKNIVNSASIRKRLDNLSHAYSDAFTYFPEKKTISGVDRKNIKKYFIPYSMGSLADFYLLKEFEVFVLSNESDSLIKNALNPYALYGPDTIDYNITYLENLKKRCASKTHFLFQVFLDCAKYAQEKKNFITVIEKCAQDVQKEITEYIACLKLKSSKSNESDYENIDFVDMPIENIAPHGSNFRKQLEREFFIISTFVLFVEKLINKGYSHFGPLYLDKDFRSIHAAYNPTIMREHFKSLFNKYEKMIATALKEKELSHINSIIADYVGSNYSQSQEESKKKREQRKKKKNKLFIEHQDSEDSQDLSDHESIPEHSEETFLHNDISVSKASHLALIPVLMGEEESPFFANFKKNLIEKKEALSCSWGVDFYKNIEAWVLATRVFEKKESNTFGDVFFIDDSLNNQQFIIYNFNKKNIQDFSVEDLLFHKRVEESFKKHFDNQGNLHKDDMLHAGHPFLAYVVMTLGDDMTYVPKNPNYKYQPYKILLGTVMTVNDKIEVVFQLAKNNKKEIYHWFAKPLDPSGLSESIAFYGNINKENVAVPEAFSIKYYQNADED